MVSFDLSQCIFFSSFSAKMAEVSANFLHLFLKIMGNHDKHYHDRLKTSPKQGLFIMVSLDQQIKVSTPATSGSFVRRVSDERMDVTPSVPQGRDEWVLGLGRRMHPP
jgi:hypothetical protein